MAEVAIIGGGLCGLALAIALEKRDIPYRVYESRATLGEIGAGINLGANALNAFAAIVPELSDEVWSVCATNEDPNLWLNINFGAPTARYADHSLVMPLMAPGAGSATAHRKDLLHILAKRVPKSSISFNKKLASIEQAEDVTITFEDGTTAKAGLVIGCDGIHSAVRKAILKGDAAVPHSTGDAVWRALLPLDVAGPILGTTSQIILGPGSYIITYPAGDKLNLAMWTRNAPDEWFKPHERESMVEYFKPWGETVHRAQSHIKDAGLWTNFAHTVQTEFVVGRVLLIGDAAHSSPPHQGAGSGQAMEDAFVLAEALAEACTPEALHAFVNIRQPRFQKVIDTSFDAMNLWSDFWKYDLMPEDVEKFTTYTGSFLDWLWDYDVAKDGPLVREEVRRLLKK